jgi:hypothetical protein
MKFKTITTALDLFSSPADLLGRKLDVKKFNIIKNSKNEENRNNTIR